MISRKRTVGDPSYVLTLGDNVIDVFHTVAYTVTIQSVLWPDGYVIQINDISGNAGSLPITIQGQVTMNINGSSSFVINENHGFAQFTWNAFFQVWVLTGGKQSSLEVDYNLTAAINDVFAPPPTTLVKFTTDGVSHNVTGITSNAITGRQIMILNRNAVPGSTVDLLHQNAGSSAVNRFITPTGGTISLNAGDMVLAVWEGSPNARWRITNLL